MVAIFDRLVVMAPRQQLEIACLFSELKALKFGWALNSLKFSYGQTLLNVLFSTTHPNFITTLLPLKCGVESTLTTFLQWKYVNFIINS